MGRFERLVLLGDIVELRQGPLPAAMAAARPVLVLGGRCLLRGRLSSCQGNHDHHLLTAAWRARCAGSGQTLDLATDIDWRDG